MSIESEKKLEKYWISLAGVIIQEGKCLILEFAQLPGVWDIPGGRVEIGEKHEEAFIRELEEEIGFVNVKVEGIVDYDLWYTSDRKLPMCAIAHLVEAKDSEVKLSEEHLSYKWIGQNEIENYKYIWPNTARMIERGFEKYNELKNL